LRSPLLFFLQLFEPLESTLKVVRLLLPELHIRTQRVKVYPPLDTQRVEFGLDVAPR
jgi:hypothetical protein